MAEPPVVELLPRPSSGRVFEATRLARFGDLSPGGRLRLDAVARYLQDVSSDDTTDSGLDDDLAWVVRRLVIDVHRNARFREHLTLATWCSGTGSRWAERRVSISGGAGARIEAGVLWVHVDFDSGRAKPLGDDFLALYGESAAGRRVGVKLQHPALVPEGMEPTPWSTRFADYDMLGHVNNAAYLAVVEEELARRRDLRPPFRVEVEYRTAIERDTAVSVVRTDDEGLRLWMVETDGGPLAPLLATATVSPLPS